MKLLPFLALASLLLAGCATHAHQRPLHHNRSAAPVVRPAVRYVHPVYPPQRTVIVQPPARTVVLRPAAPPTPHPRKLQAQHRPRPPALKPGHRPEARFRPAQGHAPHKGQRPTPPKPQKLTPPRQHHGAQPHQPGPRPPRQLPRHSVQR